MIYVWHFVVGHSVSEMECHSPVILNTTTELPYCKFLSQLSSETHASALGVLKISWYIESGEVALIWDTNLQHCSSMSMIDDHCQSLKGRVCVMCSYVYSVFLCECPPPLSCTGLSEIPTPSDISLPQLSSLPPASESQLPAPDLNQPQGGSNGNIFRFSVLLCQFWIQTILLCKNEMFKFSLFNHSALTSTVISLCLFRSDTVLFNFSFSTVR